jgi:hypothetical protein
MAMGGGWDGNSKPAILQKTVMGWQWVAMEWQWDGNGMAIACLQVGTRMAIRWQWDGNSKPATWQHMAIDGNGCGNRMAIGWQ